MLSDLLLLRGERMKLGALSLTAERLAKERDEARAIARRLAHEARPYCSIGVGSTLTRAVAAFDALPWAKELEVIE